MELVYRFIIGGLVVSCFAVLGDMLRPKGFAGILGAAPSVALATLGITFGMHGGSYVGLEGRSMIAGAVGMLVYSLVAGWLLKTRKLHTLVATCASGLMWAVAAFGIWGVVLR